MSRHVSRKVARKKARKNTNSAQRANDSDRSRTLVPFDRNDHTDLARIAEASRQIATMSEPRTLEKNYLRDGRIIFPEMQDRKTVNAFREIRTKLMQLSQGQNIVIMMTSVTARGGSSLLSLNLAAAFAFDDSKTALLVDCNLRDPRQHELVGVEPELGLTDYLENPEVDAEKIIYPSGIHRLRIIPVGRRRESVVEHFNSLRMKKLIDDIQDRYPDR